jgi:structural maintenance of chromosome 2
LKRLTSKYLIQLIHIFRDFGLIFKDLLSGGNTCKLVYTNPDNIAEGLDIHVCLGGIWKKSLKELSGGQRSLVALSLIFSLLQFKPAPMYILDEIDAALDLSHTQNIGLLFKNRFKGAQFIVVSLKEGMFNNANVLFKAKFKDGTSQVERYARQGQQKKNIEKTPSAKSRMSIIARAAVMR